LAGRTRVDDVINSCPVFVSAAAHFRGPTGLRGDGGGGTVHVSEINKSAATATRSAFSF